MNGVQWEDGRGSSTEMRWDEREVFGHTLGLQNKCIGEGGLS